MIRGFCSIYKQNSVEFSIDFSVLEILMFMISYKFSNIRFSNGLRYQYSLRVLERCSNKPKSTQRHVTVIMCSTFGSKCHIISQINVIKCLDQNIYITFISFYFICLEYPKINYFLF